MANSEQFYDNFGIKLITDFAYGNLRIYNAINFVLANIDAKHKRVLDIGCGIGWTSYEVAKNFPEIQVDAIDLSSNSIDIAQKLFKLNNLKYFHLDVTSKQFLTLDNKYDLIIMIDVFEHISQVDRKLFLENISNYINDFGTLILTYPSPEQTQWLILNAASTMQPVDEKIEINIILDAALQLKANIKHYEYKDVWHENDYIYCILQKRIDYVQKHKIQRKLNILDFNKRKGILTKNGFDKSLNWSYINALIKNDYPKSKYFKNELIAIKRKLKNLFFEINKKI